jgi:hypothetical protein
MICSLNKNSVEVRGTSTRSSCLMRGWINERTLLSPDDGFFIRTQHHNPGHAYKQNNAPKNDSKAVFRGSNPAYSKSNP